MKIKRGPLLSIKVIEACGGIYWQKFKKNK